MTRAEFVDRATELGIDPRTYDLDSTRPESYVVAREGNRYKVFYSERGLENGKELFDSESAALERCLGRLARETTTRLQ